MGLLKKIFFISLAAFILSFIQKDKLPDPKEILRELYREPSQTQVLVRSFEVTKEGEAYLIQPLYNYELYGLIVSQHNAKAWWDYYHKNWGDFLNVKDIGVIWGDNLKRDAYKHIHFSSGSWTLRAESKIGAPRQAWSQFNLSHISNNHLLADKPEINKVLMGAGKGDQIYMRGYLVNYSRKGSNFTRATSTSRDDIGGKACETVFLTDFKIIKEANPAWRRVFTTSKYVILACMGLYFLSLFRKPSV